METAVMKLHPSLSNSQVISKEQEVFSDEFGKLPVKKIDELVTSQSPSLRQLDRKSVELCVFTCIGDYLNFIGADMKDEHILETAQMMIDNHPHIPIDAIKTFFYECKRGTFGFHYNKMDGSKLLMWFDKFVGEYYKQVDDYEYAKHQNTKGDLASPLALEDEEGQPIDYDELLASFHGKSKDEMQREQQIAELRLEVQKKNMHLFDVMPVEEADKLIEEAIIEEMRQQGLLTF